MNLSYLPPALTAVGALVGLAAAWTRGRLVMATATLGWLGILVGAVCVQFGPRMGVTVAPVPTALAMAGSAALVVVPAATSTEFVRRAGTAVPALVAGGGTAASLWHLIEVGEASWPQGALLIGTHWSALGAALSAALVGPLLQLAGGGEGETARAIRSFGRDFSARAVAFVWLAWTLAILVHWRFLGAPGIGARAEWFGLGMTLLATGGLLFGWSLEDDRASRFRAVTASLWVAGVLVAGVWLSFAFGSPFQLAIGS